MNRKIGVFDSGLGGLSILKELVKLLPNEDYLFYEDSINNPYGQKTEEELLKIVDNVVKFLLKEDCKIIVIACNTAIKVAYDNNYKNTIILSTPYTMKSSRVEELIHDYHREDQNIINISGENLANLIELDKKAEIMELLNRVLGEYKDKADSLILGCTHYSLIKDEINSVLPNTVLLDGCVGVSNEVKHQLENNNLLNNSGNTGSIKIINSKDEKLVDRSYEILWS